MNRYMLNVKRSGGAAWQIAYELTNLIKVYSSFTKTEFLVFLFVSSQLILKYAYMLDILIHHIVNMTYILTAPCQFSKTLRRQFDHRKLE